MRECLTSWSFFPRGKGKGNDKVWLIGVLVFGVQR